MPATSPFYVSCRLCALLLPLVCLPLTGRLNAQTPPPPALVVTHSLLQNNTYPVPAAEGSSPNGLVQGSDGFFYGTAQNGGSYNNGTIFKVRGDGSGFSVVTALGYNGGSSPNSIVQGSDGVLYGTSGYYNGGSVFRVNTDGTGLQAIHNFGGTTPNIDGSLPSGRLVPGGDGYFYGATTSGGSGGGGTLFKITPDGLAFIVIHVFNSSQFGPTDANGAMPSPLTLGPNGVLYGTTHTSGISTGDTIFKVNKDGSRFTALYTAGPGSNTAQTPNPPMTLGADGTLYGAFHGVGAAGNGSLFKINTDGTGFTLLHSFTALTTSTSYPVTSTNADGANPQGLVQAGDGYFYGTANSGGANGTGTAFRVSPDGATFQVLHTFSAAQSYSPLIVNRDGINPLGEMTVGSDGLVYGTAVFGGVSNSGTVFRLLTTHTHILWNKTDGTASLWSVDTSGSYTHAEYGPYPGWTATAVASGGDGLTHLLWNHASDGEIALWTVTPAGFTHREYGPYPGWTADALAAGPDGLPDVLWNYGSAGSFGGLSAGTASLWHVDPAGNFLYQYLGPYPGWTAAALAVGGNGLPSLLWNHTSDGEIALSSVAPSASPGGTAATTLYGPFTGWTAAALSAGADSVPHILWNNTNGQVSLWNVNTDTTYQHAEYGPYSGWSARSLATGPDNISHLLWDYKDGTTSLWALDTGTGIFSYQNYGPFSGWTAVAVSAGP